MLNKFLQNARLLACVLLGVLSLLFTLVPFLGASAYGASVAGPNGYGILADYWSLQPPVGALMALMQLASLLISLALIGIGSIGIFKAFDKMGNINIEEKHVLLPVVAHFAVNLLTLILIFVLSGMNHGFIVPFAGIFIVLVLSAAAFVFNKVFGESVENKAEGALLDSENIFVCEKCGEMVPDHTTMFCASCGGKIVKMRPRYVCESCGAQGDGKHPHCTKCGGKIVKKGPDIGFKFEL